MDPLKKILCQCRSALLLPPSSPHPTQTCALCFVSAVLSYCASCPPLSSFSAFCRPFYTCETSPRFALAFQIVASSSMTDKGDAARAYCANLAATYERLAHDLAIPLIDQELYSCLFVCPLLHEHCAEAQASFAKGTGTSTMTFLSSVSTVDRHGDALVALGGTELVVAALCEHEQQTLLVMQAIALRESVMSRIWACCNSYDDGQASVEAAQFTMLRLLEEHQMATLLMVESVLAWRQALSRPYPFLLKKGDNYLMNVVQDCAALGATALVRSLANVRLEHDPLCVKVDFCRLLHRMEIKHRTRLMNSGAMWRLGLQPLRPIASSQPFRGSTAGNSISAASLTAVASPPSDASSEARDVAPATRSYAGTSLDFLTEVSRLAAVLNRTDGRRRTSLPPLSTATSTSSSAAGVSNNSAPGAAHRHFPFPSPHGDREAQQRKQRRLLTATRVLGEEAFIQRMLIKELYPLAHEQERFVPLLKVAQLFSADGFGQVEKDIPEDSWPLEKATWSSLATTGRRVNRLNCMSTAREVLQAKHLLPAWERRMSNSITDLATTTSAYSVTPTTSVSLPAEGSVTPFQPTATQAQPCSFAATTTPSSCHSNSFKNFDVASSESFGKQREPTSSPKERAACRSKLSPPSNSTSPKFSSSPAVAPTATVVTSQAGPASSSSSSSHASSATSSASSFQTPSHKQSLEELRRQLLAEHRRNSDLASMIH
nr:unnamed protein product [Leishmania braziliensis]